MNFLIDIFSVLAGGRRHHKWFQYAESIHSDPKKMRTSSENTAVPIRKKCPRHWKILQCFPIPDDAGTFFTARYLEIANINIPIWHKYIYFFDQTQLLWSFQISLEASAANRMSITLSSLIIIALTGGKQTIKILLLLIKVDEWWCSSNKDKNRCKSYILHSSVYFSLD